MTSETSSASAAAYDSWSTDYDSCQNPTRDLDTRALRSNFETLDVNWDDLEIVEFGCGTGRHTQWILEKWGDRIKRIRAFDLSEVSFYHQFVHN